MSTFKKLSIPPGVHVTPQGPTNVGPERIRHWHESIQGILAGGYNPPLSWGHVKGAEPHTKDDHAYWSSRFNAGKVVGSEIDEKGHLVLTSQAPGFELENGALVSTATLPDGTPVRTSIDKVSIGAKDWTDGKGKVWKDAPIHLALVPLPVWEPEGGQPGFEAVEDPSVERFSTETYLATDAGPDKGEAPGQDDKPPTMNKYVEEAKVALVALGLTLPADTDGTNILERICVACGAIKAQKNAGTDINTPVTEEQTGTGGGSYMSTDTAHNPLVAALVARVEGQDRAARLARIADLERRGLSRARAVKLREKASEVHFSLDAAGQPAAVPLDETLEALEDALPKREAFEGKMFSTTTGTDGVSEVEPPEGDAKTRTQKVMEEYHRNTRLVSRNGA